MPRRCRPDSAEAACDRDELRADLRARAEREADAYRDEIAQLRDSNRGIAARRHILRRILRAWKSHAIGPCRMDGRGSCNQAGFAAAGKPVSLVSCGHF